MINFNSVYANVFQPEVKKNYVKANISTSRKDQNDEYVNSNWFAYFFGKAKDKAEKLEDKSRIFIMQGAVTCEKYEDDDGESKYYTNVKIFDFMPLESNSGSKKSTKKKKVDDDDEDEPAPKKSTKKTAKKTATKKKVDEDLDDEDDDDDDVPF